LSRREQSPSERFHAQNRKQIRRDELSTHLHGLTTSSQAESGAAINGHGEECPVFLLPISKVRIRNRSVFKIRFTLAQRHQPFGFGIRQATEQTSVHNREQRGIRTYSQRQRDHRNRGKPWIVAELPQRIPDVLK